MNKKQRLSEISQRIKEIKSNGPVGSYDQARELALLAMERSNIESKIFNLELPVEEIPDGWRVYHRSEASDAELHKDQGEWFYQPIDFDEIAINIYSLSYPTRREAIDALEEEILDGALRAAEDRSEL